VSVPDESVDYAAALIAMTVENFQRPDGLALMATYGIDTLERDDLREVLGITLVMVAALARDARVSPDEAIRYVQRQAHQMKKPEGV
jgi:hypothetical protein